jgi:hypothetical protein
VDIGFGSRWFVLERYPDVFFVMVGCNLIYSKLDGSGPIFWIYIWLTIPFFLEHVGYFHFSSSFGDLPMCVRNQYPSALPILCSAVKSPGSKTENPQFLLFNIHALLLKLIYFSACKSPCLKIYSIV